mmetsp:Transcript_86039/g.230240  ORF Transcript_86039/g.230240 Transcript_86039/m.230240 type:complete len:218 (-) Transcript_86039:232-885(-)
MERSPLKMAFSVGPRKGSLRSSFNFCTYSTTAALRFLALSAQQASRRASNSFCLSAVILVHPGCEDVDETSTHLTCFFVERLHPLGPEGCLISLDLRHTLLLPLMPFRLLLQDFLFSHLVLFGFFSCALGTLGALISHVLISFLLGNFKPGLSLSVILFGIHDLAQDRCILTFFPRLHSLVDLDLATLVPVFTINLLVLLLHPLLHSLPSGLLSRGS